MDILLWIAGSVGGYGAVWFASIHGMAKVILNPKNTSFVHHKSYYDESYYSLEYIPSTEALSEEVAKQKVDRAFSAAAGKAWIWPITWPFLLLSVHFGKSRLAHQENFVSQQLEVKRSRLLVQILNANLDQEPIMTQAAAVTSEEELKAAEKRFAELEANPRELKVQQRLNKVELIKQRFRTRVLSR